MQPSRKPPLLPPEGGVKIPGPFARPAGAKKPWFQSEQVEAFLRVANEASEKRRAEMDDIEAEDDLADRMQYKRRWWTTKRGASLFEQAARTPGTIARTFLFLALWLVLLVLGASRFNAWGFRDVLSIIPFLGSAILAYVLSRIIWRAIGESARDVVRMAVRFWPITIVALVLGLGALRLLLAKS